jgi:pyruvate formate lyase activating enzyme
VAYTYTEPTVFYEYMFDTAVIAKEQGVKNLAISNGYINERPLRELCRYLDAANIDLKSFSDETYRTLFRGKLKPVLDSLLILKDEGAWLEITNLVIPGVNDSSDEVAAMCGWLAGNGFSSTPLHFSRFHPMHKMTGTPLTPLATMERARNIALEAGMLYVYIGNVPGSGAEHTFCPGCGRKVVERSGFRVGEMNLLDGACKFCGTSVDGVWQ